MSISPKAIVDPRAKIGANVTIDAFATIEGSVVIGDGTHIKSHAIVMDDTVIGKSCMIYPGAILGGDPQDLKYKGEQTKLIIEDHVTIREYSTINRGTAAAEKTHIKQHALIMAYTHIAHDCIIGEHAVIANSVNMAGHVIVEDYAIIGGMTALQQFVKIGESAFIGGGTLVRKDVPPYIKAAREPLSYVGVNSVGLKRRGVSIEKINAIKDVYRILFIRHKNITVGLEEIDAILDESEEKEKIVSFINASENGLIKGFRQNRSDDY